MAVLMKLSGTKIGEQSSFKKLEYVNYISFPLVKENVSVNFSKKKIILVTNLPISSRNHLTE